MANKNMEGRKKKVATLVGCNYAGTPHELRGCINDVLAMRDSLVGRFGFAPGDVTVLTDERGSPVLPTGANIKRALADMVARAAAGDVLFFHYSGHGTLVPAAKPPHHGHSQSDDGGEAIVPCDLNLITDVDFRELVDRVPRGATFTMVSDSCHSGGLIDQEKEQIGPSVLSATPAAVTARTARFLPYGALLDHLSGFAGVAPTHHVADQLLALFGADASAKFHHHGSSSAPSAAPPPRPDEGILLSGCQRDETSADVPEDDEAATGGKACGAFSSAVQAVLAAHPVPVSNRELVARAREVLREQGFEQHPCLYCSDASAEAPFLWQQEEEGETAVDAVNPAMSAL